MRPLSGVAQVVQVDAGDAGDAFDDAEHFAALLRVGEASGDGDYGAAGADVELEIRGGGLEGENGAGAAGEGEVLQGRLALGGELEAALADGGGDGLAGIWSMRWI